jgi:tetratricopeptide (TPR) repeat protein
VQAVLATRLAQLSPPARQLAEVAATIGRQFSIPLLQQAGDADEEGLTHGLDELWRRRIVRERGLDAYDFSHDKLRETAYTTLSPARRRLLHHRVAQALESIHGADLDPASRQIAAHYRRAGRPAQAIPYYLRAGQVASRIYAQQEAIATFERALALLATETRDTPPSPGRSQVAAHSQMAARCHEGLGDVLAPNQPGAARRAYADALQELSQEDLLARARLHRKIAKTWWPEGEHEQALEAAHRALSILGPEPTTPDAAWWNEWGQVQELRSLVCYYSARMQELDETVKEMERGLEHHTTPMQQFYHAQAIGAARLRRDRYVVSEQQAAQLSLWLQKLRESADPDTYTRLLFFLGWGLLLLGDLEEAEEHLQEALALAERTGHLVHRTWSLTQLCILYRRRGDAEATRECARRCLQSAMSAQQLENAAVARGNLAWIAWREGDLAEAEKQGQAALELWEQSPFVYAFHWTARIPLLVMALAREQVPEALDHARALLDPQQQKLPDPLEASLEAAIQAGQDRGAEAAAHRLERAIQVAKETGYL